MKIKSETKYYMKINGTLDYVYEIARGRLTQVEPEFVISTGRWVSLSTLGTIIRKGGEIPILVTMPRLKMTFRVYVHCDRTRISIGCQAFTGEDARRLRAAALRASRYSGSFQSSHQ